MKKYRVARREVIQPLDQSYRLIPLTRNQNAIVDATDYEWLMRWNWHAWWNPTTNSFYARRGDHTIYMASEIIGCVADHKNHDTLDNRRENLRPATALQNVANTRIRSNNSSGFIGVSFVSGKWRLQIRIDGKKQYAYFLSAEEAAKAHDAVAKELHGEFAVLNFS